MFLWNTGGVPTGLEKSRKKLCWLVYISNMNLYIVRMCENIYLGWKCVFVNVSDNGYTNLKTSSKAFGKVIWLIGKWLAESVENFVM